MKSAFWLFCICLCSVALVQAQSSEVQSSGKEMTAGRTCYTSCLTEVGGVATCDLACTSTAGDRVFVDDQGNFTKIGGPTEQEKQATPSEREREKILEQEDKDAGFGAT